MLPRRSGFLLLLGLLSASACGRPEEKKAAPPRPEGVVGQVTAVQGPVTWSRDAAGPRKALAVGDAVQAGWFLHTGVDAKVTLRLRNGHLWSLGESSSKRAGDIQALSLEPIQGGALDRLADQGGPMEVDRTGAAGIQQERSAAGKAVSSREPERPDEMAAPEEPARPASAMEEPPPPRRTAAPTPRNAADTARVAPAPVRTTRSAGGGGGRKSADSSLDSLLRSGGMASPSGAGAGGGGPAGGESAGVAENPSTSDIRAAMNLIMPALRKCLAAPAEAGTYVLRITLASSGRPTAVAIAGQRSDTPTARCLERTARRLSVKPFRAASMAFTYPLILR